jgi:hypothetical protein
MQTKIDNAFSRQSKFLYFFQPLFFAAKKNLCFSSSTFSTLIQLFAASRQMQTSLSLNFMR